MANEPIKHGEFVEAEPNTAPSEISYDELRKHTRISLKEKKGKALDNSCDGLTVEVLVASRWGWRKKVGIANIKDLSLGGVGLITRVKLKPDAIAWISVFDMQFQVQIKRISQINANLTFYGAKWQAQSEKRILTLLGKVTTINGKL